MIRIANLSESLSDDDNYPILESIHRRKQEREKNLKLRTSPFRKGRDDKDSLNFNLHLLSSIKRTKGTKVTPPNCNRRALNHSSPPLTKGRKGAKR